MPAPGAWLTRAANGLLAVTLAPECAACGRVLAAPLDGPVCAVCWDAVRAVRPPLCACCGDPLPSWRLLTLAEGTCPRCRRAPPAYAHARAAGDYDGALRDILHAFKYDGRRSLAGPLAARMREAAADLLRDADLVVPVPLHPWRRLGRGFNQAEELAKRLGPPVCAALWRVRATRPQAGLRPAERRRNVGGAFRLSPLVPASRLRRARVVLVDDLKTTGATLHACARILRAAGAREVSAVTAAAAFVNRDS